MVNRDEVLYRIKVEFRNYRLGWQDSDTTIGNIAAILRQSNRFRYMEAQTVAIDLMRVRFPGL